MKKRKTKNIGYLLSFLDVLSNSMAAVLILTIVRMQPSTPGEALQGFSSIHAIVNSNQKINGELTFALKLKNETTFYHLPKDYYGTFTLVKSPRKVKLLIRKNIELSEIEELVCHIDNPYYHFEKEEILIEITLPKVETNFTIQLNSENERKYVLIKNGKINNPNVHNY